MKKKELARFVQILTQRRHIQLATYNITRCVKCCCSVAACLDFVCGPAGSPGRLQEGLLAWSNSHLILRAKLIWKHADRSPHVRLPYDPKCEPPSCATSGASMCRLVKQGKTDLMFCGKFVPTLKIRIIREINHKPSCGCRKRSHSGNKNTQINLLKTGTTRIIF